MATYTLTAPDLAIIRTLIPDTEMVFSGTTLFTDGEIGNFYSAARGSILRAAGYAVLAIATSEAIISKVIRTQDLQTNGATLAEALRKQAETFFKRADAEDELDNGFYFNIVDFQDGWSRAYPELTEFGFVPNSDDPGFGEGGFGY